MPILFSGHKEADLDGHQSTFLPRAPLPQGSVRWQCGVLVGEWRDQQWVIRVLLTFTRTSPGRGVA